MHTVEAMIDTIIPSGTFNKEGKVPDKGALHNKSNSFCMKYLLSVPERSEETEVSKMAIREGIVFWGVWGVSPPL